MISFYTSHAPQCTEGIILRVIPYRDYDQIITLFTEEGLLKILFKGSLSKRRGVQGITMPLTKVQLVYREKEGEIYSCLEMSLIDTFSSLRKELIHLEVACELLQILFQTQLVGKAAPKLYALLCFYLDKIPKVQHPKILSASFRLKLLRHDGLAAFPFQCNICQEVLVENAYIQNSDWWCRKHQSLGSQHFGQEELNQIYGLALSQRFQAFSAHEVSVELQNKIKRFFDECIEI